MKEAYCSYEIAKLLKEKGFDWDCITYYVDSEHNDVKYSMLFENNTIWEERYWSAPTHQMVMKWLREVHNIDVDIDTEVGMLGIKVYVPSISTYKPIENTDRVRQRKRGLYYKNDRGITPAWQHFFSYEEAVEAALKYALENLIEEQL